MNELLIRRIDHVLNLIEDCLLTETTGEKSNFALQQAHKHLTSGSNCIFLAKEYLENANDKA